MRKTEDFTGMRVGHLTVLRRSWVGSTKTPRWYCRCDCGRHRIVAKDSIVNDTAICCKHPECPHNPHRVEHRRCPCGKEFIVGGRDNKQRRVIYCSKSCSGSARLSPESLVARDLTKIERAYLAAIIDGEGTITLTISTHESPKTGRRLYYPTVCFYNTNNELIQWAAERVGVGHALIKSEAGPRRKACWVWKVHGPNALAVLKQIYPYLRVKRKQAQIVLAYNAGKPEQKDRFVEIIRGLNRRGGLDLWGTVTPMALPSEEELACLTSAG